MVDCSPDKHFMLDYGKETASGVFTQKVSVVNIGLFLAPDNHVINIFMLSMNFEADYQHI